MFRKKKQSKVPGIVVNGQQSGVQENTAPATGKRTKLPRLSGKRTFTLAAALLLVGVGLAIAGLLYQRSSEKKALENEGNPALFDPDSTKAEKASLEANISYNAETGEGYENAISKLDEGLSGVRGNDEQTAQIYISKATVYMNAKKYQDALEVAQKAEELNPSIVSAAYLAQASEELGKKEDAIKYYQLTIDRINAHKYRNQSDVDYYQDLLDKVRAR